MGAKLAVTLAVLLISIPSLAQVQPAARTPFQVQLSAGAGMDYWSGDWGAGHVNRWGPTAWATATIWHCLGINAEGHSMILGGNREASHYKLFISEGGLMCTTGYWGRFQPTYKGELGFASLSQTGNGTGHLHSTYSTWSVGGGVEYHTWGHIRRCLECRQWFHGATAHQTFCRDACRKRNSSRNPEFREKRRIYMRERYRPLQKELERRSLAKAKTTRQKNAKG